MAFKIFNACLEAKKMANFAQATDEQLGARICVSLSNDRKME